MKIRLILLAGLFGIGVEAWGDGLADPLVAMDGAKITTAAEWRGKRRPELLEMFAREMYGRSPGQA
ncbi:MAG: hypothetical protein RLZZ214_3923, partial [Verrucomicrobiota bacterium]